jgi:hypothetical protein
MNENINTETLTFYADTHFIYQGHKALFSPFLTFELGDQINPQVTFEFETKEQYYNCKTKTCTPILTIIISALTMSLTVAGIIFAVFSYIIRKNYNDILHPREFDHKLAHTVYGTTREEQVLKDNDEIGLIIPNIEVEVEETECPEPKLIQVEVDKSDEALTNSELRIFCF